MVSAPEMSSRVPAEDSQLNLKVAKLDASPFESTTCRPGQENSLVTLSSASLTVPIWAIENTAMMIRYGR